MKALTVYQPWATLLVIGAKLYEFRGWAAPRVFWGQRIVIHAARRKMIDTEIETLRRTIEAGFHDGGILPSKALPILARFRDPDCFPLGCGVGTGELGTPARATELFPGVRGVDPEIFGWPVLKPEAWANPVPAQGAQGFWKWGKR